jgi:hypothetical protein
MVSLGALWLPILLAAVFVFIASSIIHMVLKYHNSELRQLPNEDAVRTALRGAPPGQYMTPYCPDMKDLEKPEVKQKFQEGPVGMLILRPPGAISMGPALTQWFIFCLVVSLFAAYVASRTLPAGTAYLPVFRITATVAFMGYGLSSVGGSIWMGKPWSATLKELFDALIYGLVTGGVFGWRWPEILM